MCLCTNIELLNTKLQTVHYTFYSKVPIHVSGSWNETSFKNKHVQWNHLRQTASEHQSYYFLSWSCVHFFSSVQDLKISPSLLSQSWISPESEFHCVNKKSYIVNTSCVHKKKLHGKHICACLTMHLPFPYIITMLPVKHFSQSSCFPSTASHTHTEGKRSITTCHPLAPTIIIIIQKIIHKFIYTYPKLEREKKRAKKTEHAEEQNQKLQPFYHFTPSGDAPSQRHNRLSNNNKENVYSAPSSILSGSTRRFTDTHTHTHILTTCTHIQTHHTHTHTHSPHTHIHSPHTHTETAAGSKT